MVVLCILIFVFFFQAEDGIRDLTVTGVQTCALPIFGDHGSKLVGIHDINQPPTGAGWTPAVIATCLSSAFTNCAADGGAEQTARPFNATFPFLAQIYQMGNIYRSNYNGLQATLT